MVTAPRKLAAMPPPGPLLELPSIWLPSVMVTPPSRMTMPALYIPAALLLLTWLPETITLPAISPIPPPPRSPVVIELP